MLSDARRNIQDFVQNLAPLIERATLARRRNGLVVNRTRSWGETMFTREKLATVAVTLLPTSSLVKAESCRVTFAKHLQINDLFLVQFSLG